MHLTRSYDVKGLTALEISFSSRRWGHVLLWNFRAAGCLPLGQSQTATILDSQALCDKNLDKLPLSAFLEVLSWTTSIHPVGRWLSYPSASTASLISGPFHRHTDLEIHIGKGSGKQTI